MTWTLLALLIIVLIALIWFFFLRPQRRAEQPAVADAAATTVTGATSVAAVKEPVAETDEVVTTDAAEPTEVTPAGTEAGPHAGSVLPAADGTSPHPDYAIKGSGAQKFHAPESPYYKRTKAAVYFDSEESAEAAGFVKWRNDFYQRGTNAPSA